MKQFNLDEYLKNPNKKVITRDGKNVRIVCTDFDNPEFPVICQVKGSNWPIAFTTRGLFNKYDISDYDLFFAPEKHEGWVNIYCDQVLDIRYCKCVFDSEEEAIRSRDLKAIATVKIKWEE